MHRPLLSTTLVVVSALAVFIQNVYAKGPSGGSPSGGYSSYKGARAVDGDTYRYHGERYRVQQYNAPEIGQPGSRQATRQLQQKLDSGSHEWKPVGRDTYGRPIVHERPAKN